MGIRDIIQKTTLYVLYTLAMRQFLRLIMGVRYYNKEVLEDCKQYVIVANHNSHFDTMALLAAVPGGHIGGVKAVAAGDYFGKTGIKKWASEFFVDALLIPRSRPRPGTSDPDPIQMMIDALDNGNSLIIFPEGTRGEPGVMQPFKKGIGLILSERPYIPFVPVYMQGIHKLLPKGGTVPVPFDNSVRFGQPVFCKGMTIEEIVARAEAEVLALRGDG